MLKQINFSHTAPGLDTKQNKSLSLTFSINAIFLLVQIVCSCLAGVYNEYLLKKQGDINIFVQNVFMYLDSIVCNLILLTVDGNIVSACQYDNIVKVFHYKVLIVMLNNALIGIVTSFFLKTLNSILKTFASALELVLTAVLSYVFFHIPIYLNTVLSIAIVMLATYLYSQNPVQNVQRTVDQKSKQEEDKLLQMEEV